MAYFYSWTLDYVRSLNVDDFNDSWEAITIIESQESLNRLSIQDWPQMKKSNREKLHKGLFKKAYPDSFKEVKRVSNEELAKLLSGG